MNMTRTAILLAGLTGLFMAVGFMLAGESGMVMALVVAAATNLFAYWNSDRMVLGMYGAHEVNAASAPALHGVVGQLARSAGLPMPRVYIIDDPQPNAFATGPHPERAAVAATTGLLRLLSREELAGVMAHELAHVKHRDTLLMTVTATLAGALGMLANMALWFGGSRDRDNPLGPVGAILIAILAPIAAMLVQMAISRTREYAADREGAEICGRPLWLASALEKLEQGAERIRNPTAEANPATAHLFIVNPLRGGALGNLFATHPSVADRVRKLREMTGPTGPWG